ncbi:hypothetical protein BKA62DRAFT_686931 [Auriculariales sp. MPI-PUGE-AT-0066]|nr:hypothetical protein BKA62DRAFT_686931 [Auriculariales sp. MPI-PUGE-AT-0066]
MERSHSTSSIQTLSSAAATPHSQITHPVVFELPLPHNATTPPQTGIAQRGPSLPSSCKAQYSLNASTSAPNIASLSSRTQKAPVSRQPSSRIAQPVNRGPSKHHTQGRPCLRERSINVPLSQVEVNKDSGQTVSSMLLAHITKPFTSKHQQSTSSVAKSSVNKENARQPKNTSDSPSEICEAGARAAPFGVNKVTAETPASHALAAPATINIEAHTTPCNIGSPSPLKHHQQTESPSQGSPVSRTPRRRSVAVPEGALQQALAHQYVANCLRAPVSSRIHAIAASKDLAVAISHMLDEKMPMLAPIASDYHQLSSRAVFPRAGDIMASRQECNEVTHIDERFADGGYKLVEIQRFAWDMETRARTHKFPDFVTEATRDLDGEIARSTSSEERSALVALRTAEESYAKLAWDYAREVDNEAMANRQWSLRWFLLEENRTRRQRVTRARNRLTFVRETMSITQEIRARYVAAAAAPSHLVHELSIEKTPEVNAEDGMELD